MPEIKEKPKVSKPKGRRKSTGPPKQAGRLMKEKFIKELDQRKAQESGDSSYAVDQVELAGYRGADEFVQSLQSGGRRRPRPKTQAPKTADSTGEAETGGVQADQGPPPRQQPANPPKERSMVEEQPSFQTGTAPRERSRGGQEAVPIQERPRIAAKERKRNKALQGQTHLDNLPPKTSSTEADREPSHRSKPAAHYVEDRHSEGHQPASEVWKAREDIRRSVKGGTKPKTGAPGVKERAAPMPGGKPPLGPKVQGAGTTSRRRRLIQAFPKPAQAARQSAQRRLAQQAARTAKGTAELGRRVTAAAVRAVASVVGSLVGLVGGGVVLVVLICVVLIAAIASSPFGIFFTNEPSAPEAVSVSQAVSAVNVEYNAKLEALQAGDYDDIVIHGQGPDWAEVLAVFAVHTAGKDEGMDVVTLDQDRLNRLKAVFWDMTEITSKVETIDHPGEEDGGGWTESILHITITPKTADDMRIIYAFTRDQNSALTELLSGRAALASLIGSLTITNADVLEVLHALPADLDQARKEAVETALSLAGKVNYFWGGKSLVIGWDSRWGQLTQVWADGSSTTGTYRPYGLDCSGFMDWIFYNLTGGEYILGRGGGASAQHSYCTPVSQAEAQPGDLAFYSDDSHVGIVVGRREDGKLLVCHCSSGQNNVVVTEFSASGFTYLGRPDIFR